MLKILAIKSVYKYFSKPRGVSAVAANRPHTAARETDGHLIYHTVNINLTQ